MRTIQSLIVKTPVLMGSAGLLLALSACSGSDGDNSSPSPSPDVETPTQTPTATPVPTDGTLPELELHEPQAASLLESTQVLVTGVATDDIGVVKVVLAVDGKEQQTLDKLSGTEASFSLKATLTSQGVHTLKVSAYDAAGNSQALTLDVTRTESNDDESRAFELSLPAALPPFQVGYEDPDWYAIEVQERTLLVATLVDFPEEYQGVGAPFMSLSSPVLGQYFSFDSRPQDDGTYRAESVVEPGEYLVNVYTYEALLPYQLEIFTESLPDDDGLEENDTFQTPTAVSLGQSEDALMLIKGDDDWYQLTLTQDTFVDMLIAFEGTDDAVLEAGLMNSNGQLFNTGYALAGDPLRIRQQLPAGDWLLALHLNSAAYAGYRMSLTEAPVPAGNDGLEPNDVPEQAAALPSGETAVNLQLIDGESDWFTLTLPAPMILTVDAVYTGEDDSALSLAICDEAMAPLESAYFGMMSAIGLAQAEASVEAELPAGTYRVQVDQLLGAGGTYSLNSHLKPALSPDNLEPNDSPETASAIVLPYHNAELVLNAGNPDYFTFTLSADQSIQVEIAPDQENAYLYADLTPVGSDAGGWYGYPEEDGKTRVTGDLTAGTYLLQVYHYGMSVGYALDVVGAAVP